ncbi:hypothetical protein M8756_05820 [Lutimaribacter sp. EGI FJ00015]|uniref:Uncharacterized protein n=1 Tax=Lutimaribacter degradans TaxID=2945989 RepID=A0ACC5ZT13_9RHOB|nr:hypothetical protein [Lutimaribacter sp. EGI FJ00013]MCM2561472.1 hypothetical protein [Lutimaribacter sp. EGI FJ00013]MCO0612817.1 hypothetical protein [Lutimaribacter sp. EGI FJ00015]MCO0635475.1 hypothetical protein [Lutimaribacter sp. EGI FJ00014]
MIAVLHFIAAHGRWALVMGLAGGLLLPGLSALIKPFLPHLVALLLYLNALRIGRRAALGRLAEARQSLWLVLLLQLALPLAALVVLASAGLMHHGYALAFLLMLSAPAVTGSVNFTIMLGHDPAPALRLLVLGTALLPLTVLPILWLGPDVGAGAQAGAASLRLLLVIFAAAAAGFATREWLWRAPDPRTLDGLNAVALAVIVVGLMAALGPALQADPGPVLALIAAVMAVNFALQIAGFALFSALHLPDPVGPAIVAGNRNAALFLMALPPQVTEPLLILLGCYQLPMYLTPILMTRIYGRKGASP